MGEKFTPEENGGLRKLLGQGLKGAEDTLGRDTIEIPEGVTSDTLERYKKIAEDAIARGRDKTGVQEKRIKIIDRLSPQLR